MVFCGLSLCLGCSSYAVHVWGVPLMFLCLGCFSELFFRFFSYVVSREVAEWSPAQVPYGEGAIVQHRGHLFVGLGTFNTAQPGSAAATILFVSHTWLPAACHLSHDLLVIRRHVAYQLGFHCGKWLLQTLS